MMLLRRPMGCLITWVGAFCDDFRKLLGTETEKREGIKMRKLTPKSKQEASLVLRAVECLVSARLIDWQNF
jgi:hypothetical protein